MMAYQKVQLALKKRKHTWLITGVAGFIGSHLLEQLLLLDQRVVGLDNFSTGKKKNLDLIQNSLSRSQWGNFQFIEGDIVDASTCAEAIKEVDFVLHQAALGSVPRSLETPLNTNASNITGFLNMMEAARLSKVKKFVYAASSSTYGDHQALPKVEEVIGNPLSPYAVTKYVNELYASVYDRCYDFKSVGLRYFNVFGPRQDPNGAYAAVIPKWIGSLLAREQVHIHGDGETSRDFCYIANVVQANFLAAIVSVQEPAPVFNVALGGRTTLTELFNKIKERVAKHDASVSAMEAAYGDFRAGDVRHSQADISKIRKSLGYDPQFAIDGGLDLTVDWFVASNQ